ncbi:transposase family protein [Nonomuraea deserti]|uniref:transposase family protein n=1 Tax=Nonomuraea deserti TaxID=1848322 RepID=UPI001C6FF66F|nr:transposase family protein [Nonomuraea deserti]
MSSSPTSGPRNYLADLLRGHLKSIRSRWRALPAGRIATIVLAVLRHDQRLADMAGGNDVSATTIRRWRDELITLLAAKAPRLDRALKKIARRGGEVVLIDGTLIPTQRRTGTANRPNYSGYHHRHGLHVLALTDERGRMIWISAARPGRTHDAPSAWTTTRMTPWSSPASRPPAPASSSPATGSEPGARRRTRPVEHGFAHPQNWRILTKLRTDPARATGLLRALFVLTNLEGAR